MSASVHHEPRFEQTEADRLGERISELYAYINAATAEFIALIRAFDEHLRVAHALAALPKISERFADGRLSYSKVRAMTRVARPENEDFLLMVAKHGTACHIERLVSQYRRMQKLQHPDVAQELYLARSVSYHYDDDGCLVMKARMPADRGEVIVKALERAMDNQDVYPKGTSSAETSEEKIPVAARRADALDEIAEVYLNDTDNKGSAATTSSTGRRAARRVSTTWCCCVVITITWCTRAVLPAGRARTARSGSRTEGHSA